MFRNASARDIFTAIGHFANLSIVFDPQFRDSNHVASTCATPLLEDALQSLSPAARATFYRVTAPRTVAIVPDTAAKRRECEEEILRTFYLSNADIKETLDVLRTGAWSFAGCRPSTAINAIAIKDTPEKIAAAAKGGQRDRQGACRSGHRRELVEVDRTALKEFGLEIASPGATRRHLRQRRRQSRQPDAARSAGT